MKSVKLALPKGRLMAQTALYLQRAGWGLHDYQESTRSYRLTCERFPDLQAKIFHEKDIPIQVAVGNYDLGICGMDWVSEAATVACGSTAASISPSAQSTAASRALFPQPQCIPRVRMADPAHATMS